MWTLSVLVCSNNNGLKKINDKVVIIMRRINMMLNFENKCSQDKLYILNSKQYSVNGLSKYFLHYLYYNYYEFVATIETKMFFSKTDYAFKVHNSRRFNFC